MATLLEITAGIKSLLDGASGGIPGVRANAEEPAAINPPAAWPFLRQPAANYDQTFDGDMTWFFSVYIIVSAASDKHGQANLMPFLSPTGNKSIKAKFDANPTLGGLENVNATITGVESVGSYEISGVRYIGAVLLLTVMA